MKNCSYLCCSPFLHLPAFSFTRGWILPVAVTSAEGSDATLVPQCAPARQQPLLQSNMCLLSWISPQQSPRSSKGELKASKSGTGNGG